MAVRFRGGWRNRAGRGTGRGRLPARTPQPPSAPRPPPLPASRMPAGRPPPTTGYRRCAVGGTFADRAREEVRSSTRSSSAGTVKDTPSREQRFRSGCRDELGGTWAKRTCRCSSSAAPAGKARARRASPPFGSSSATAPCAPRSSSVKAAAKGHLGLLCHACGRLGHFPPILRLRNPRVVHEIRP